MASPAGSPGAASSAQAHSKPAEAHNHCHEQGAPSPDSAIEARQPLPPHKSAPSIARHQRETPWGHNRRKIFPRKVLSSVQGRLSSAKCPPAGHHASRSGMGYGNKKKPRCQQFELRANRPMSLDQTPIQSWGRFSVTLMPLSPASRSVIYKRRTSTTSGLHCHANHAAKSGVLSE